MGNMTFDFSGRVAVVTGASGGIGKGIAQGFIKAGAKVVLGDMKKEDGEKTVQEFLALGGTACFVETDVSNEQSAENLIQTAICTYGRLDIVVNAAGVSNRNSGNPFTNFKDEDFDRCYNVNLKGMFHVCKAVYPHFKEQNYGRIINVASSVWDSTNPINVPYVASKAGAVSLTRNLAKELGPFGVTVNAICPGYVLTPMYQNSAPKYTSGSIAALTGKTAADMVDYFSQQNCATKKPQTMEDMANAVLFLASDEMACITGIPLQVSGGYKL